MASANATKPFAAGKRSTPMLAVLALAAVHAGLASPAAAQQRVPAVAASVGAVVQPGSASAPGPIGKSQPKQSAAADRPAFVLPPLDAARKQRELEPRAGAPLPIGINRPASEASAPVGISGSSPWQTLPSGSQVAGISVTSPDARGLRLGLRIRALPESASLRFYPPGSSEADQVDAGFVLDLLVRNRKAGETVDADIYWSPMIDGPTTVLEIEIPAGASRDAVSVEVAHVSHLVTGPREGWAVGDDKAAGACNLDAMCYDYSGVGNVNNSVARIAITTSQGTGLCTGTLLNDIAGSRTPYFLTANHCISTQSAASSVQFFWFYRSAACNSGNLGSFVTTSGGGTLLYATIGTDTSFLRLNQSPPAGTTFAGWDASTMPAGAGVFALHHPDGDPLKISFGNVLGIGTRSTNSAGAPNTVYNLQWAQGTTEGGSSGSALLNPNGAVVGQLWGGAASCATPSGIDQYGRFDLAYYARLSEFLANTGPRDDLWPRGAIFPAGWTSAGTPWRVASDQAYSPSFSLKSGSIGHSGASSVQVTGVFAAGAIKFARKVSSEANFDFLRFYIDGALADSWSGDMDWAVVSYPVSAGTHTLRWEYSKDDSVNSGADAAWIDSVELRVLAAAVLPGVRAVGVNGTATAFATLINPNPTAVQGCSISIPSSIPAVFTYQTTDPRTNAVTGTPNTPVSIGPGAAQTFVFTVRPAQPFTMDIPLQVSCADGETAPSTAGLNTFRLTSSAAPTPDVVALAATPTGDGIVRTPGTSGSAAFSVATVNVGAAGTVVASVEGTGAAAGGTSLSLCPTNAQAACEQPPAAAVTSVFGPNQTRTFSVFVTAAGRSIPLDPANSRVFVRFRAASGTVVGATSVAVQTQ